MATGHNHADPRGSEVTHLLLCELFDPDTTEERRETIRNTVANCPECAQRAESELEVRAMVRDCCGHARAPEPLRERIITSITRISYTEIRYR
ncbi:hypothetical protein [Corynebacterium sp. Marseille-P4321]|uniref:hypothetical protein n=1 Tax=Corynebacterium sp. Marseille-P4321 TaxID=2736603 RepID=UPI000894173B|nr:hypothetical protein [Corynebacterium sp. Marseille-P4321]OEX99010.1 hypothetical protein A0K93_08320 [Corynebacterium sp. BCW_4722]